MDRDTLYYHFSNLGLMLIGFFSIQSILNPFVTLIVITGTVAGFLVSWQIMGARPQHMDTFTGMLSLAACVVILSRLYDASLTFENLLKMFSTALVWLTLFQSFGLKTGKSYATVQFISVSLLIASVALALEQEFFYIIILVLFLFNFIFAMRLNLVCEKKRKGSLIIGDQEEVMSLWQQIKVAALMFSFVLIAASLVYPFVPRFENLSLKWIPSTLLGLPEQVPILKSSLFVPKTIKENKKAKEQQTIDDGSRKRETSGSDIRQEKLKRKNMEEKKKEETVKRFRAKEFDKDIEVFKVQALTIRSDKKEVPLDRRCKIEAELKMTDGSTIPATQIVDWKVSGTADVSIDNNGNLVPKTEGYVRLSASYMGNFSNDVDIKIMPPAVPAKKKTWVYYLLSVFLWLLISVVLFFVAWIFMKSKRLAELAVKNPKEFIKEIYASLCRGFSLYGVHKFDYMAHREFYELAKAVVVLKPEPMRLMTEGVLKARFSTHEISVGHSQKALELFHNVQEVVLEREGQKDFWKKILFRILLVEVLLVPRRSP